MTTTNAPETPEPPAAATRFGNQLGRRLAARLDVLLALARLALIWEKLWPRLVPFLAAVSVFLSLALLDVLPKLPFWLHVAALVGFAAAIAWTLRYFWQGQFRASHEDARHRVERDSDVAHRPLTAIEDRPAMAFSDQNIEALWTAHLRRMTKVLGALRLSAPAPGMARRDPWGFRAAVALLLVIAVGAGGGEAGQRLERALQPKAGGSAGISLDLDIWITPPAYTRMPPVLLQGGSAKAAAATKEAAKAAAKGGHAPVLAPLVIPVGSTVLAQLGRARGAAELKIGARAVGFDALEEGKADQGRRVETEIDDDDLEAAALEVRVGGAVAGSWPVRVVADQAPSVEFLEAPKNLGRGLLQVLYEAKDDYALSGLRLVIRHAEGWPLPGGGETSETALPLPNPGAAAGKGQSTRDFSDHPWAGLPVEVSLVAVDAAGQEGETDGIKIALPERTFNHPVARAVIGARKKLNRPGDDVPADVVSDLEAIAEQPAHFFNDTTVFLALSIAQARLRYGDEPESRVEVQKLLWDTALRIEDGEYSIAEREMRDVQDRLQRALKEGADDAEIEKLMDELQRAMDKYMQALAEHLKRNGLTQPINPETSQLMESQDLQKMLDQARQLSQAGAREAARQMLSQLNQMLNALRNGARLAQPNSAMNKARQMMKGLRDLSRRQQQLLDRTFRRQQNRLRDQQLGPRPGQRQQGQRQGQQQGQPQMGDLAPGQQNLRRDLGRMMLQMDDMLGAIPPSLGEAERAMKGAGDALRQDDGARAARDQTEALNALRRATDQLAEQMARQSQGSMGVGMGQPRGPMPEGRDPFGRRPGNANNGNVDDGDIKVPSQLELMRAREIMQELRRRSGEQFRPRPEREYIDRLIKRF